MGYDVGVCGAFGLLLSDYKTESCIVKVYDEFLVAVEKFDPYESDESKDRFIETVSDEYSDRFIEAFKAAGIVVPEEAVIFWTGDGDDRPGRCDAPLDDYVLGFGLLTTPWSYPPMDESFRKRAHHHTWVWGG